MNAFVNGALSALNRCLNLINIMDPEGTDLNMVTIKNQILIYIEMYKSLDEWRQEHPIKDETWEKIKAASTLSEEQLEILEEIIAKA